MATQYGIKFAVHIITSHFGNLVAKVCECLLRKGPLPLPLIVRYTEFSASQVKNSLLVLIQHNCVQAFILEEEGDFQDGSKVNTHYIVLFSNILHRMRFSKFLAIVLQDLDKQCEQLLEGLLEHGRLTLKQMFDRAKSSESKENYVKVDDIREVLHKLVTARYVECCPTPEPVLTPPSEDETPTRKRGAKSAKIHETPETLEQRVLAAAIPMEAKRFSIRIKPESDTDGEKKGNDSLSLIGEKRKHDSLESEREYEEEVIWRANFEEFLRRIRHKTCVENVRARLDNGAATVLSAMLEATRYTEKKVKSEKSVLLSVNTIYEEVIKSEAGRSMTLDRVHGSLIQLGSINFVRGVNDSYHIDFKSIIELAQNNEVESIVLNKYGRDAYRMFRLLLRTGRLVETNKISDITFVEKKDASKILYTMWKDEYLHMEKLTLNAPKQPMFLLWEVNKHTLREVVLDQMLHAAVNLNERMAYEVEQEKELLNLPKDILEGPALKPRYTRLKNVRMVLESSLMKLDDAIMLFSDF